MSQYYFAYYSRFILVVVIFPFGTFGRSVIVSVAGLVSGGLSPGYKLM